MNNSWWNIIKNDLGWVVGIIGLFVAGLKPFLDWINSRRTTEAGAHLIEAQAVTTKAEHDLTISQASEKIASTATKLAEKLEARMMDQDTRIQSLLIQLEAAKSTIGDMQRAIDVANSIVSDLTKTVAKLEKFVSFPELNPQPILEVDEHCKVLYANPAVDAVLSKLKKPGQYYLFIPKDFMDIIQKAKSNPHFSSFSGETAINGDTFMQFMYYTEEYKSLRIYNLDITERKLLSDYINKYRELSEQAINKAQDIVNLQDELFKARAEKDHNLYRVHEAYKLLRDLKKNYPKMMEDITPPSNADEDAWMDGIKALQPDHIEEKDEGKDCGPK